MRHDCQCGGVFICRYSRLYRLLYHYMLRTHGRKEIDHQTLREVLGDALPKDYDTRYR